VPLGKQLAGNSLIAWCWRRFNLDTRN